MPLSPNSSLGHYRIGEVIGEGGMGQVYRATDTVLDRDVALKVLPESFANDADRIARFEREAKTLAALNHHNIAQIHGIERGAVTAIVMELVDGPTLADKIADGPLPADEALFIARQILDGLEAAHAQGIVHRDLKPANVKLRPDGVVKILDFGIAKPVGSMSGSSGQSPTRMTPAMTETGVIMGTAAYMSPEQARGKAVDQRTDIWAFGCLLFEMLTGQPAFMGEDVVVVMASILRDKSDLNSIPAAVSPAVRHTIKLCLEKDPKKRLHHVGDVRLALAGTFETFAAGPAVATAQRVPAWKRPLPLAAGMLLLGAALAGLAALQLRPAPPARPVNRFSYQLPAELDFRRQGENVIALAPDGRNIVMNTAAGLYLRSLETLKGRLVPGTEEDLDTPFFSADGQSLAYWTSDGVIKRIALSGGAPVVLAQGIGNPFGASWDASGVILVADEQGIKRFPATGGAPELLFPVGEGEHFQSPQLLPDGDTVLYSVAQLNDWDRARIVAQSITRGERKVLVEGGADARYVATGHLVYALKNGLFAQALDTTALTLSGSVVPLVQDVERALYLRAGLANYGISNDGTLVYLLGGGSGLGLPTRAPVWVDRQGQETATGMQPCACADPAPSPDGTRIAFKVDAAEGGSDIWIWSIAQGTFTRLTFEPQSFYRAPMWSPDGERIAYGSGGGVFVRRADGTGQVEKLTEGAGINAPFSWSAQGEIIYGGQNADGTLGLFALSLTGDRAPRPLPVRGRVALSPDGRWLAYASDESGQPEIYVRPYPDLDGGRWQVSQDNGTMPQWSADSSTLFFAGGSAMMAARVVATPAFAAGTPEPLFNHDGVYFLGVNSEVRGYAAAPDGDRLLMLRATTNIAASEIVIVQNWTEELQRLVPTQ
jgi:hypothetical protein